MFHHALDSLRMHTVRLGIGTIVDLMALTDFNAVALYGGFGAAGRALDRPKATLSRRVAELEESLGVRLIERGSRRLRLTEDGIALHERTRGLIAELQDAGEAVASRAPIARGRLRISAPVVFAHRVLGKVAARFALAYPQVELEIVAEDRFVDPVDDGYDLVIRINPPADELLIGRRILSDTRLLVGAPTLLVPPLSTPVRPDTQGDVEPTGLPSLPSVRAVMMPHRSSIAPAWRIRDALGAEHVLQPVPVLRLSSLLMVRDAVLAGVGMAMLPALLVADDVSGGKLRQWGVDAGPPVEIWALYSSRRLLSAKVRAFLDMLQALDKKER